MIYTFGLLFSLFKTDSEEENELSHTTTRSTLSTSTTAKDTDDDCVEVDPQIHTGMSSHGTTRADGDGNPGTSSEDEDGYGTNHLTSSAVKRHKGSDGNPGTSGHDGSYLARRDGNPGMSVHDEDYSSYLSLMAALSDDLSDDEDLNQAIIASMESQM